MSEKAVAPDDLEEAGRKLWEAVVEQYDLDEHELALLRESARTVDLLEDLQQQVGRDGSIIMSPQGMKAHPAVVELRQQRIALARLMAALRMPAGDESDHAQGRRPQRKVGVRGVYGIRGGAA